MATSTSDAIRAILAADATYAALSTGGIVSLNTTGAAPVNLEDTPAAYADVGGVKTFAHPVTVVAVNLDMSVGPTGMGLQESVRLSVYQPRGYDVTHAMLRRARVLLHGSDGGNWFTMADGRRMHVAHESTPFRETVDPTIKGLARGTPAASMEGARYLVTTSGG